MVDAGFEFIPGYGDMYAANREGQIFSFRSNRLMKPYKGKGGYFVVTITSTSGKKETRRVHRMIAMCFCNKPEGCDIVNHLDMNIENNFASNLEWTTISGNTKHAFDNRQDIRDNQMKAALMGADATRKMISVEKGGRHIGTFRGETECALAVGVCKKTIYNGLRGRFSNRDGFSFREVMPV